jgi:hypothetical protein
VFTSSRAYPLNYYTCEVATLEEQVWPVSDEHHHLCWTEECTAASPSISVSGDHSLLGRSRCRGVAPRMNISEVVSQLDVAP